MLPLIFVIGYLPLLLHVHFYDTGLPAYDWGPLEEPEEADLFLWVKMAAMIVAGLVMLILLIIRAVRKELRFDRVQKIALAAVAVYGGMVLLSALFSKQRFQAFFGSFEMFESALYILACLITFVYAMAFVSGKQIRFLAIGAAPGLILLAVLCILQALGLNFLDSSIVRYIITPPDLWAELSQLDFSASLVGGYGTLYNPNYVLPFFGFILFAACCLLIANKGRTKACIFYIIVLLLSVLAIWASGSKTALITLPVTILVGAFLIFRGKRRLLMIPVTIGLAGLIFVVLSLRYGGVEKLASVMSESFSLTGRSWPLQSMITFDDGVVMEVNGHELYLWYDLEEGGETVSINVFSDEEQVPLYADEEGVIRLDDEKYSMVKLIPYDEEGQFILSVFIGKKEFEICDFGEPQGYLYRTPFGKFVPMREVENAQLFPEQFLNWRGGLWNRTIPKLKDHVFLGSGANTFLYEYPQDDYVYRANRGGRLLYTLEVKPHSFFLQQWVENGLPALIACIAFYAVYLIWSIRLYMNVPIQNLSTALGLGLFLGSLNYMLAGLTTDSTVNTASFFWCCTGIGFALNAINKCSAPGTDSR